MSVPQGPDTTWDDEADEAAADARSSRSSRAQRRKWWIIGGVGVLVMSVIAAWFGVSASGGVSYSQAGFIIQSDSLVTVKYDVVTPQKKPVICTLIAMNDNRDVLGTKVVTLPASKYESTRYTTDVKTTAHAVTGTVQECHYVGDRAPSQ